MPPTPPGQHQYLFYFFFTKDSVLRVLRLPQELLVLIPSHLLPKDLCIASLASRDWDEMVFAAGLKIHRTLNIPGPTELDSFVQFVDMTFKRDFQPRIALQLSFRPWGNRHARADETIAAVARAAPLISSLTAYVTVGFAKGLCDALSSSAPVLHTFAISEWSDHKDDEDLGGTYYLPLALFEGEAPCLRTVTVDATLLQLPAAPIRAFVTVRAADLTVGAEQLRLLVARLFPSVTALSLTFMGSERVGRPFAPITIDLSNRQLVFTGTHARRLGIPAVDYKCAVMQIPDVMWLGDTSCELNAQVHVTRKSFLCPSRLSIALSAADGTWRHTVFPRFLLSASTSLGELRDLPLARLASLTVAEGVLGLLLQTPLALSALRALYIAPRKSSRSAGSLRS
ncbi:hypothetical protein AURDEDRAFT_165818 [Auricularia subglabra TFB-10046 SS5]|nr:hypothetical protein AURDEDRAFT_165818 [Auricularia subglabra TFB-10046 SS5]